MISKESKDTAPGTFIFLTVGRWNPGKLSQSLWSQISHHGCYQMSPPYHLSMNLTQSLTAQPRIDRVPSKCLEPLFSVSFPCFWGPMDNADGHWDQDPTSTPLPTVRDFCQTNTEAFFDLVTISWLRCEPYWPSCMFRYTSSSCLSEFVPSGVAKTCPHLILTHGLASS